MKRLPDSIIRQGLSVRAQIAAALSAQDAHLQALEEFDDAQDPTPPPSAPEVDPNYPPFEGCVHPAERRMDTTTAGGAEPSFFCRGCRRSSEELKRVA